MEKAQHKVLLVEDMPIAQKAAGLCLTAFGCTVDIAATGREALALFSQQRYTLILMDLGLPDMDGITVTDTIRRMEASEDKRPTPIIALTAHEAEDIRASCLEAGMNDFLIKPLTRAKAQAILEKYGHHRSNQWIEPLDYALF